MSKYCHVALAACVLATAIQGCAVIDRADPRHDTINRAAANARNESILLNIVRASQDVPFDVRKPAVTLSVGAKRLLEWKESQSSAGPMPVSPVVSSQPLEQLKLVPYGAAKLRITEFPYFASGGDCIARNEGGTSARK